MHHNNASAWDVKFKCPVCGGSKFGTSYALNPEATGHCHSYLKDGTRCKYVWKRVDDDGHFVPKELED